MFGRKRRRSDDAVADEDLPAVEGEPTDAEVDAAAAAADEPMVGPWDVGDAPEDDLPRLDLGALRIPTFPGVELRVDANQAGEVVAATLVHGGSGLQLGAFAAPRSEGIWNDVRGEIFQSLRSQGGAVHEQDGPFGAELVAKVPSPEGHQDARFVGVDGPRWFLRGVFTGPAATNPQQAELLERSLRELVVVRGEEAKPVRDPLPMAVPREALEQQAADAGESGEPGEPDARQAPPPPERGPEITETR